MPEEFPKESQSGRNWQEIAQKITQEKDGKKVAQLAEELVRALDEQKKGTGAA